MTIPTYLRKSTIEIRVTAIERDENGEVIGRYGLTAVADERAEAGITDEDKHRVHRAIEFLRGIA